MSNYVAANINNEGRSITSTNDDGYNHSNNNLNTSNNTQNLNIIKTRKKSSNKTNLRNLKRNEKFFKKFQQEIESSTALISSTTATINISSNYNPTFVTSNLLKSTSTTVIPPIITNRKHSNLTDLNDNDLFDSQSPRSSNHQIMNAIKLNNKTNNFKKISAIPIKTKNNNDINNKQSQLPASSTLIHQTDSSPNHQMSKQSKKSDPILTQTIDQTTVNLEDFDSSKNMSDEFDMDLKPVFSKSLANKIKNHYKSINSENVYNSIDSNAEMVSDTSVPLGTNVVPALNDKFFKNNNKHSNLLMPKPLNSKIKHSKSNSFESSSFLLNENGFASKNVTSKVKQFQKK